LKITEYLIETADRCIRIANSGRQAADELSKMSGPDAKRWARAISKARELADELEAMGHDMLAKAVDIDTTRQKENPGSFGP
jgi:hypothetical protein